ncbi:protease FtsH subunit HflC [Desulfacinum hydrothermale DSM 13146]|uniref:Protein HflC n=1 Tax=Desulfacinum hydrothermale DSM 13146 TaxID=1121390 RepID=A0A1W1X4Z7_9BACT|nr:protease modulator HflC [Desulfacinum hydrothermale]SMC18798.1 protease FtsH subunit HflC [Desulfacinum hydrothermale DSM 13146]
MMPKGVRLIVVALFVIGAVASSSLFVVTETEQVVITQLGRPVGEPITQAGLHFKLPLIQKANFFEKRVLKWDGSPNQIPTRDKKYIWVDTTARWHIKDPLLFLQSVGTVSTAMSRLDGIIDSVVRDHVSNNNLVELVRSEGWEQARDKLMEAGLGDYQLLLSTATESDKDMSPVLKKGREKITREMLADAARLVPEFGIELLDIRIKRINYVQSVQRKVFDRMISERKRIAAQYRSEGEGEKAAILGKMDRELARIQSEAYRKAQEIRGKADAEATRIYAEVFGQDPEFYQFYKTLDFYRKYDNPNSLFLMGSDADLFRYLKRMEGADR